MVDGDGEGVSVVYEESNEGGLLDCRRDRSKQGIFGMSYGNWAIGPYDHMYVGKKTTHNFFFQRTNDPLVLTVLLYQIHPACVYDKAISSIIHAVHPLVSCCCPSEVNKETSRDDNPDDNRHIIEALFCHSL